MNNLFKKLLLIITSDKNITDRLNECFDSPESYFEKYADLYDDRSIEGDDMDEVRWLGLVDCLIENNLLFEFDYCAGVDDFVYGLNQIKGMPDISEDMFDEDSEITDMCATLNDILEKQNMMLACFDIDSDSYPIILIEKDKFELLCDLAEEIGHRIDRPENM